MKLKLLILLSMTFAHFSFAQEYSKSGLASYYGRKFHGKKTANGERFDMNKLTAAHRSLPFNSIVKVTNLSNGKAVIVRINDRGPVSKSRVIDLSKAAAQKIDMVSRGIVRVKVELMEPGEIDLTSPELADCCHSAFGELEPLSKYDFYGNKLRTDGDSIAEKSGEVFNIDYIKDSFSRVKVSEVILRTRNKGKRPGKGIVN